jgi:predicted dehydrogenase/threonine dehydrogenase-like Zn-dependent dehydrogenase
MKLVAQNYRSGELGVVDVPPPACRPGGVLVRSRFSLISTGTEMMKVKEARLSVIGKARARPDQVRKVVDAVTQLGPVAAYKKVTDRLDAYTPLGYSVCGVVTDVGSGANEFAEGQLVACAGNEYALHAEVNWVPTNLCVAVPPGVAPRHAAFATVGAVAMHGIRRAEVQLGDSACVIGLGLVGQLVVQLLLASGVRVVGLDVVPARCAQAERAGALLCADPRGSLERVERRVAELNEGRGVDHVFLAAGGSSNEPVHCAARLARDRARVVDIGKCRLDLPWNDYYDKELDVRFSRSYGPGRYDDRYELDGIDYPAGYVRWTERRNLQCFLDLVSAGSLDVDSLVTEVFPIDQARHVYDRLDRGELDGTGFLFEYPAVDEAVDLTPRITIPPVAARAGRTVGCSRGSSVRVGFIGAGNYATSMLLPRLVDAGAELVHVATRTSLGALNAQRRFGFVHASTDPAALLDDAIDAVFVVTRHASHAEFACRALERGLAVFVEKPLALDDDELTRILDMVATTGNDRLTVGFNRRFAPLLADLKARFGPVGRDAVARYLVNAGPVDTKSWYADDGREGSRFSGEGGHFIDTLSWWLEARPVRVHALRAGADDLHVSIEFENGSIAAVTYVTSGSVRFPKETIEVSASGRTARFDNFRRASVWTGRRRRTAYARGSIDKGQRCELRAFLDAVHTGGPMPIPLESLAATTSATIAVGRSLATGVPCPV